MYLPKTVYPLALGKWYNCVMTKGKIPVPSGHVNLRMLAEHLGLSQTTVSLVLNNSPSAKSIPTETRARVVEAAKQLNYRPNYFARSLRRSKSMSVGVLAPDLSEGYFTRVMSGVVQELNHAHYFFFTACHYWDKELLERYPRLLIERAVDGFLLLNTTLDDLAVPVPVVAISAHSTAPKVTNIVLDHYVAAKQALKHLYDLGHRRIAFMHGPAAIPDSEYRWVGIQKVAQELGLSTDASLTVHLDASGWPLKTGQHPMDPQIAYDPTRALLEKNREFTALFCFNDTAAMGAIRAIKDAGLDVPGDISVVGFDDITSAAFSTPSLTTVHQPLFEMGQKGAKLLLEQIANREKQFPAEIEVSPELVVRESTGPVKNRG
jgi:LacI family transcriptional regulator